MGELVSMIRSGAPIAAIADYLDAQPAAARAAEVDALGRRDQASLFERAADAPRIELAHFVPDAVGDLTPVHHAGRNTIATLGYFQRFEKRFARPAGERERLFGYNASNAWFIHPGYFVARATAGNPAWEPRGGVVIDYFVVPDAAVPDGWPPIRESSAGLQRLVYHRTRDFMRRVSSHVSIGRASREVDVDELLDYWFTLCRRDPGAKGDDT